MKNIFEFKNIFLFFIFLLIFLPYLYLLFYLFFPNFKFVGLNSLAEYAQLIFTLRLLKILFRSLGIGIATAFTSTLVGLVLALILECTNLPASNLWKKLLFLPFLLPSYLFVFTWLGFLGKRGTFTTLTFPNVPINVYNPFFLIFFLTFSYFPFPMFLISLGLKNLNQNLIDAAKIYNSKKILRLIRSLIFPHILIAFFITFSFAVSEYIAPSFLRINTYQNEIFIQLATFYDVRKATFYSLPLLLIFSLTFLLIYKYFNRNLYFSISSSFRRSLKIWKLTGLKKFLTYVFLITLLLLSIGIPLVVLLVESEGKFLSALTLAKWEFLNSIALSFLSAFLVTCFAILTLYFSDRKILNFFIIFPLMIPSPLLAISLIVLTSTLFQQTFLPLLLAYFSRFLPFSLLVCLPFFIQIQKNLFEAARLSTSSSFKILRKILFPLSKKPFLNSFILIFILCFSEILMTQLLIPPGFQTLALRIETLLHYGNYSFVASLNLISLIFILILYSILFKSENL